MDLNFFDGEVYDSSWQIPKDFLFLRKRTQPLQAEGKVKRSARSASSSLSPSVSGSSLGVESFSVGGHSHPPSLISSILLDSPFEGGSSSACIQEKCVDKIFSLSKMLPKSQYRSPQESLKSRHTSPSPF